MRILHATQLNDQHAESHCYKLAAATCPVAAAHSHGRLAHTSSKPCHVLSSYVVLADLAKPLPAMALPHISCQLVVQFLDCCDCIVMPADSKHVLLVV